MDISLIVDNGRPWPEVRDLAQAADELGAYAVYLCDHFMGHTDDDAISDEPMLECLTLLGALGPLTSRAKLGPMVLGSTYRHPAAALEPYREVCHEFVVFDWFDRPLPSTLDDITSALEWSRA